jgi:nucleoid-associated protein YgaU
MAACAALIVGGGLATTAAAQNFPITPTQRATAEQVASAGVPLSELAPDAPDSYTVVRGDTLWAISGKFLKSPWRWPELWGMNMDQIHNPHLIYPGQTLYLEKVNGLARLRLGQPGAGEPGGLPTVRVSPRTRISGVDDTSIPLLPPHIIEPFLNEAIILNGGEMEAAPRIVGVPEDKVLLTRGDRAYARGREGTPLVDTDPRGPVNVYRIYRNPRPLKHPVTGAVLGYEASYLGSAELVRSESVQPVLTASGQQRDTIVPASIDITRAKEEIRVGDRLMPEPPRGFGSYVPHAPRLPVDGSIVSVYGDAVSLVGQNQVVALTLGMADGIEPGNVLTILRSGRRIDDRTIPSERAQLKLPDEPSGMLMVFRTFDRLSYALVLEITDTVMVGDRVTNPR